uniref:HPP transmembrane region domain-containing protein n=1 Tax=Skeletonema marinoi TaxID=267567 RepID=A0A7S2LEL8_9STRA|mmetsp:Transcript_23706/g.40359  ORF Transcript_23706/g.40359 Transcript_23706/m.40359 type:complete len:666 (+) Transcript_23706:210-2207(+)
MNVSPTFSKFSQSPPGLSWLLSGGTERTQNLAPTAEDADYQETTQAYASPSQASLLSQSSSNGGSTQYNSMSHSSSVGRMNSMSHSTSMGRMNRRPSLLRSSGNLRSSLKSSFNNSSSGMIPPELSMQQQQPEMMQTQQEPMDILLQSVFACTANIFGLYGLEVWKFDQKSGFLTSTPMMPPNALDVKQHRRSLFIKRIPQEADYNSPNYNPSARDAFERLTVTTRLDYCSKNATDPGVGVAGALWSESNNSSVLSTSALAVVQSGVQTLSDKISDKLHLYKSDPLNRSIRGMVLGQDNEQASNRVLWRDINSLAEDPDQPYDERLQLFAKAGFALAAGISFNIRGFKGIVVFFANPHADMKKLSDNTNSKLIEFAAQFIGSAVAVRVPLQNAKLLQTRRPISNWKILRVKILAVIKFQRPIHVKNRGRSRSWGSPSLRRSDSFHMLRRAASVALINREESFKILSEATARLKSDVKKSVVDIQHQSKVKTIKWWQKVQGGHASIPPSFNNTQCLWTFTGVLSTHVVLSRLACFLARGGQYRLVIGPLGALTTLQYNLTAAPASQPRNAFFAQGIALCTCYLLHKFPGLDVYHRCTLAPTIVATLTARLGLIHPPAGATSVVFSIENYGIEEMILFLVGNLIAIVFAVTINNMSEKRQYPTTKWI